MAQPAIEDVQTPAISLFTNGGPANIRPNHLIFFITGNPGLIGFYSTYLQTLQNLLVPESNTQSANIHIYGQSQAGFSDEETPQSSTPYSLEQQIVITLSRLQTLHETHKYDKIILMGHSMGAYILLELIRRSSLNITSAILLFPTVTHIAQSPNGIKISKLFRIPHFPGRAAIVAKTWLSLFPVAMLRWMVGVVTGMPVGSSDVTTQFLRSRMGIWQALHLAKDEMETITEDRWDDEIWGVEKTESDKSRESTKLIFYFGQNDEWVANHTRDALIAAHGQIEDETASSKPVMIMDKDNIPHGFCVKHSEIVAEKTKVFIENILWG